MFHSQSNAFSSVRWRRRALINPRRQCVSWFSSRPDQSVITLRQGQSQRVYHTCAIFGEKCPGSIVCLKCMAFFCINCILIKQYVKGYFYSYTPFCDWNHCVNTNNKKELQYKMNCVMDWFLYYETWLEYINQWKVPSVEFLPRCHWIYSKAGHEIKFLPCSYSNTIPSDAKRKKKDWSHSSVPLQERCTAIVSENYKSQACGCSQRELS